MSRGDYLRFVLAFLVSYVLLRYTLGILLQSPLASLVALITGCSASGHAVLCGYNEYVIVPECTGVVSVALLIAMLYVLPIERSRAVRAAVFGSLFLLVLNVFRVAALVAFTRSIFSFDVLHTLFWFASPLLVILYVRWLMK